ncbi:carbohydrate ABC transporter permease [Paenibacillus psychroresistens]|nr:sugar ABC transporter permease [Paenibacillus psychroresistens]
MERKGWINLLFILPALLLFTAIIYYPLFNSIKYSFTSWNMTSPLYEYIGFKNYADMFSDDLVKAGFKNTFVFTLYSTLIGNSLALLLALVLDSNLRAKKFLRSVFYIPCLLSPIVISAVFGNILQYHGVLNEFFHKVGLDFLINDWFANAASAMPMLIILNAWQYLGYGSIIYLAGLQTIPAELYETARMDGASKFKTFRFVTFPLLMPSITIMTFMSITGGLKLFDIPFVLTQGGPGTATETMGTVIFKIAFRHQKFGYATAISVVFFILIAVISVLQVRYTRKREVVL